MNHYFILVESIFRVIFKILFFPYNSIRFVVGIIVSIRYTFKYKDKIIPFINENVHLNFDGTTEQASKALFYMAYDEPLNANWRKFKRQKINKWIISLIVWSFLFFRFSIV